METLENCSFNLTQVFKHIFHVCRMLLILALYVLYSTSKYLNIYTIDKTKNKFQLILIVITFASYVTQTKTPRYNLNANLKNSYHYWDQMHQQYLPKHLSKTHFFCLFLLSVDLYNTVNIFPLYYHHIQTLRLTNILHIS